MAGAASQLKKKKKKKKRKEGEKEIQGFIMITMSQACVHARYFTL